MLLCLQWVQRGGGGGGGVVKMLFFSRLMLLFSNSFSLGDGLIKTEILSQRDIKPQNNKPTNQHYTKC